ncbi:RNA polymerase sigma factor [Urechidicola croceus]|uniref:RNA polymerase subunit sigma-70 n=1 Tax=Urechidicola croceus TaxID=1850246 RepID=A0A1D8P6R5_9FLAO|nr:sigma-70 family RNA polymerase sigma factor [Urechidicola croceus]AOW20256.1 RNA polymerase subunit sigma-70 [Urechidicola croceus]
MFKTKLYHTDLIKQCRNQNRKAQLKLYNQYCDAMYNVAFRFMKNSQDAEDVMQEAFIKAFSKINTFKGEVTFGAWLKRIVVNKSIDTLKSVKYNFSELDDNYLNVVDDNNWEVADEISAEEVKTVISRLPQKYELILTLYLMEGYDHQEISQILNITEVNSRTQLLRGKQKLKELLKQKGNGTGY